MEQLPKLQHITQEKERKKQLFLMQKNTLDSFLERGAISPEQYKFSYNGLVTKMNISKEELALWGITE